MKNKSLKERTLEFAKNIIDLVKALQNDGENIISSKICSSGTSIGANIHKAQLSCNNDERKSKLQLALEYANETSYWLKLLYDTRYINQETYNP